MRGDERSHISIPTAEQHRPASIIILRQTQTAVLLRHFDSKRSDLRESLEIFRWNFPCAIDFVRIDMIAQITLQPPQKIFARRAVVGALRRPGVNSVEIVATDEKIARKTAAIIQRVA